MFPIKTILNPIKRLSTLDVVLLSLMFAIMFSLTFSYPFLKTYHSLVNDADMLSIEHIARDLNAGSNLFDWHLSTAPYLFPDILLARLIAPFSKIAHVSVYYHVIFGIILLALVFLVCKVSKTNKLFPVLFAGTLYAFSYYRDTTGDLIAAFFGLIGFHSGIAIPILVSIICTIVFFKDKSNETIACLFLFAFVFLGMVSDSLVIISIFPILFLFPLLAFLRKESTLQQTSKLMGVYLLAAILGKAFGYTNPIPQDRIFMRQLFSEFPALTQKALKQFLVDFKQYSTESFVFASLFILFCVSLVLAIHHIVRVVRSKASAQTPATLFSLFIITAPLMTIVMTLSIGLYASINSSRYWAVLIYLSIVLAAIMLTYKFPSSTKYYKVFLLVVMTAFVVAITKSYQKGNRVIKETNQFSPFIACMRENNLPVGHLYISDYWFARPIQMHSLNDFGVVAYIGLHLYPAASNVVKTMKASPGFVITGFSLDYKDVINVFGPPEAEYCNMSVLGHELKILDYSNNVQVKEVLRSHAANPLR